MDRLPIFPRSQNIAQARRAYELAKNADVISIDSTAGSSRLVTGRTLVESIKEGPWMYRRDILLKKALNTTAHVDVKYHQQYDKGVTVLRRMSQVTYKEADEQVQSMQEGLQLYNDVEANCLQYNAYTGEYIDLEVGECPSFTFGLSSGRANEKYVRLNHMVLQNDDQAARQSALAFLRWLKQYTDQYVTPLLKYLDPVFAKDLHMRRTQIFPWIQNHTKDVDDAILSPLYTLAEIDARENGDLYPEDERTTIILCFGGCQILHLPSLNVDVEVQAGDIVFLATDTTGYSFKDGLYETAQLGTTEAWSVSCYQSRLMGERARGDRQKATKKSPTNTDELEEPPGKCAKT